MKELKQRGDDARANSTEGRPKDGPGRRSVNQRPASRVAFMVVTAGLMTVTAGTSVVTPLLTLIEHTIRISPVQAVVLYASYSLGILLALLGVAASGDRLSLPSRIVLALVLAAVAASTFVVTTNFVLLLLARVVSGLASGAVASSGVTLLIALGGPRRRERSALTGLAANFGGLSAGALLGGTASSIGADSPKLPFVIVAVVAAGLVAGLFAVHGRVQRSTRIEPASPQRSRGLLGHLDADSRTVFLRATIPGMIAFPSNGLVSSVASAYLSQELGVSERTLVGAVIAVGFSATAVGQVLVQRFPRAATQAIGKWALFVGLGSLLIAMTQPTWISLTAGSVFIGVGTGIITGSGVASITALPHHGETAGLITRYFVLLYIAIFIPLTTLGLLEGAIGIFLGTLLGCAAAMVALAVTSAVIPPIEKGTTVSPGL